MVEEDLEERISAEVMAGFEWRLTDRLGVRASVERLLRNDDVVYDRATSLNERLIDPTEIADFVTYVSSPLASAINGAALRIDGGLVRSVF